MNDRVTFANICLWKHIGNMVLSHKLYSSLNFAMVLFSFSGSFAVNITYRYLLSYLFAHQLIIEHSFVYTFPKSGIMKQCFRYVIGWATRNFHSPNHYFNNGVHLISIQIPGHFKTLYITITLNRKLNKNRNMIIITIIVIRRIRIIWWCYGCCCYFHFSVSS